MKGSSSLAKNRLLLPCRLCFIVLTVNLLLLFLRPVATVLVQRGTLRKGSVVVAGTTFGKVWCNHAGYLILVLVFVFVLYSVLV